MLKINFYGYIYYVVHRKTLFKTDDQPVYLVIHAISRSASVESILQSTSLQQRFINASLILSFKYCIGLETFFYKQCSWDTLKRKSHKLSDHSGIITEIPPLVYDNPVCKSQKYSLNTTQYSISKYKIKRNNSLSIPTGDLNIFRYNDAFLTFLIF